MGDVAVDKAAGREGDRRPPPRMMPGDVAWTRLYAVGDIDADEFAGGEGEKAAPYEAAGWPRGTSAPRTRPAGRPLGMRPSRQPRRGTGRAEAAAADETPGDGRGGRRLRGTSRARDRGGCRGGPLRRRHCFGGGSERTPFTNLFHPMSPVRNNCQRVRWSV